MAKKFVRNITGTKCKGSIKEPLATNLQNDILSDDEDCYIRNKDEYHCLTDNLKTDGLKSRNGFIEVKKTGKNSADVSGVKATKEEGLEGKDIDRIMNPKRVHELIDEKLKHFEDSDIIDKNDLNFKGGYNPSSEVIINPLDYLNSNYMINVDGVSTNITIDDNNLKNQSIKFFILLNNTNNVETRNVTIKRGENILLEIPLSNEGEGNKCLLEVYCFRQVMRYTHVSKIFQV